jgi:dihydrofolate reductase
MRKVYAGLFSSLDGVVEAPNEWQPSFDEEMGAALSRMLDVQDAVLLGRVTFTEWAQYWPTSTDEPFASWINSTPKYVASSTLDSVDQWPKSTLIKGPVADFVAELRQQDGGTIGTAGSPSLVRSLIDQGLLDELTLMISTDRDLPADPITGQDPVPERLRAREALELCSSPPPGPSRARHRPIARRCQGSSPGWGGITRAP